MHRLLREHPDISVKLIAALGQRLRDTNERLARQSFQTVQSRVAAVLAQLVEAARAEAGDGSEGDVRSRPRRPSWRSWPVPRASRRAGSSPCSSGQE